MSCPAPCGRSWCGAAGCARGRLLRGSAGRLRRRGVRGVLFPDAPEDTGRVRAASRTPALRRRASVAPQRSRERGALLREEGSMRAPRPPDATAWIVVHFGTRSHWAGARAPRRRRRSPAAPRAGRRTTQRKQSEGRGARRSASERGCSRGRGRTRARARSLARFSRSGISARDSVCMCVPTRER